MSTWQEKAPDIIASLTDPDKGNPFSLSKEQEEVVLANAWLKVVGGGEGGGKSFLGALTGVCRAIAHSFETGGQKALYWIIGSDYEQARKEFDYIYYWMEELGVIDKPNTYTPRDDKCILATTIGATFETITAYDPRKIAREEPEGIIGCEVGLWDNKEVWERCRGRLMRKMPRSWGIFTGSFETSMGWFPEIWDLGQGPNEQGVVSYAMPSWANLIKFPGGYDDPKLVMERNSTTPERFMERFGGRPTPAQDLVLPQFKVTLHVSEKIKYQEHIPIHLAIDPGTFVYTVLFIQKVGSEIWIIDQLYTTGWTHEQIVNECMLKPLWKYVVSEGSTIDFAGGQRHMGMGTPIRAWLDNAHIALHAEKWDVQPQLDRLRSLLSINVATGRPYLQVSPKCQGLIGEGGGGPSPVRGVSRWKLKGGLPEKRNDHAWKALAYWALNSFGTSSIDEREGSDEFFTYLNVPNDEPAIPAIFADNERVDPWNTKT